MYQTMKVYYKVIAGWQADIIMKKFMSSVGLLKMSFSRREEEYECLSLL